MRKKEKAAAIIKLLKKGMTPMEITQRMDASYNYAWKLKKDLEAAAAATAEEAMRPVKETILSVANTMFPEAGEYVVVEGAKSAQEVDAILNERASTYGAFKDVAKLSQQLKNVIRLTDMNRRGGTLPLDHQEALDMIASKIARIVIGDYDHVDSWVDIAGYATLVADRLQGKVR
jgi:N-methylhydantoinase B/oxoprolinase/acetone carboxylase alpha subunit